MLGCRVVEMRTAMDTLSMFLQAGSPVTQPTVSQCWIKKWAYYTPGKWLL